MPCPRDVFDEAERCGHEQPRLGNCGGRYQLADEVCPLRFAVGLVPQIAVTDLAGRVRSSVIDTATRSGSSMLSATCPPTSLPGAPLRCRWHAARARIQGCAIRRADGQVRREWPVWTKRAVKTGARDSGALADLAGADRGITLRAEKAAPVASSVSCRENNAASRFGSCQRVPGNGRPEFVPLPSARYSSSVSSSPGSVMVCRPRLVRVLETAHARSPIAEGPGRVSRADGFVHTGDDRVDSAPHLPRGRCR